MKYFLHNMLLLYVCFKEHETLCIVFITPLTELWIWSTQRGTYQLDYLWILELDILARGDEELTHWLAGWMYPAKVFGNAGQLRLSRPGIPFPRCRGIIARILLSKKTQCQISVHDWYHIFTFINGIYYIIFIDVSFYECTLFAIFAG